MRIFSPNCARLTRLTGLYSALTLYYKTQELILSIVKFAIADNDN